MIIPECRVRKGAFTIAVVKGGETRVRHALTINGRMDKHLAKALKCEASAFKDRLPSFVVERETDKVALTFRIAKTGLREGGVDGEPDGSYLVEAKRGRLALAIPAASLHAYRCSRDDNGQVNIELTATYDSQYHPPVHDFVRTDAATFCNLFVEPANPDLFENDGEADAEEADDE